MPIPMGQLTPFSSGAEPTAYDRVPLTAVTPPTEIPPLQNSASATVREASTGPAPATETMRGGSSFSPLMLVLLVLCSVVGGGAVAYFAFLQGSQKANEYR